MRIDLTSSAALLGQMATAARRVATIVHTHPDGDAIGCSIGMQCWLKSIGKEVKSVFPDAITSNLSFMLEGTQASDILIFTDDAATKEWIDSCDLLLIMDMNSISRSAGLEKMLEASVAKKVLIDHHLNPASEQFDLTISETEISSASELVYWLLKELSGKGLGSISLPAATALMTGMTTDTNNFANSTFPSTLEMASQLLTLGVNRDNIVENIIWRYNENRLRALGMLLDRRMVITPEGVAYMVLYKSDLETFHLEEGDTEGFVNLPLAIGRVRMSIFIKEDIDHFRVSVRSKKGTSAAIYANRYCHGGGHENAAGGKIYFPEDIAVQTDAPAFLERTVKDYFDEK